VAFDRLGGGDDHCQRSPLADPRQPLMRRADTSDPTIAKSATMAPEAWPTPARRQYPARAQRQKGTTNRAPAMPRRTPRPPRRAASPVHEACIAACDHGQPTEPSSEIATKLLRFHREFHRQRLQHLLAEPVDHERHGLFLVHAALAAVEQLVVIDLRGRRLVLHAGRVVLDLDVGHRVRPAFVADQQAVALGVVAAVLGLGVHRHKPAIGVLRLARADALGHDPRLRVFLPRCTIFVPVSACCMLLVMAME
jgi:hypothetical protein